MDEIIWVKDGRLTVSRDSTGLASEGSVNAAIAKAAAEMRVDLENIVSKALSLLLLVYDSHFIE